MPHMARLDMQAPRKAAMSLRYLATQQMYLLQPIVLLKSVLNLSILDASSEFLYHVVIDPLRKCTIFGLYETGMRQRLKFPTLRTEIIKHSEADPYPVL
jgi:hypothetical protein